MADNFLYKKMAEDLCADMKRGTLKAGDRLPTVEVLKARYGVSHRTVLRTYQELKEQSLILQRGRGYVVRSREESELRSENFRIGLLVRALWKYNLNDIFFNEILYGIQEHCGTTKVNLNIPSSVSLLNQAHVVPERYFREIEEDAYRMGESVDGFLFDERIPDFVIEKILSRTGKHGVLINRVSQQLEIPCVVQATRKALNMLLSAAVGVGSERFIFILGSVWDQNIQDRIALLRELVQEMQIPSVYCTFINEKGLYKHQELMDEIVAQVKKIRMKGKTILLAASDGLARCSCDELRKEGIQPGKDISIAGIGGLGYALNFYPQITTVNVNAMEMGRMAVATFLKSQMYPGEYIPSVLSPEPRLEWGETLCNNGNGIHREHANQKSGGK